MSPFDQHFFFCVLFLETGHGQKVLLFLPNSMCEFCEDVVRWRIYRGKREQHKGFKIYLLFLHLI